MIKKSPEYIHDCEECIFLISIQEYNKLIKNFIRGKNIILDIYYCRQEESIIFRYGNNSKYISLTIYFLNKSIKEEKIDIDRINFYKRVLYRMKKLGIIHD